MRLWINPKMPDKSLIAQTKTSRRSKHFRSWIYLEQSGYLRILVVKRRTRLVLSKHKNKQISNLSIKNHYLDEAKLFWTTKRTLASLWNTAATMKNILCKVFPRSDHIGEHRGEGKSPCKCVDKLYTLYMRLKGEYEQLAPEELAKLRSPYLALVVLPFLLYSIIIWPNTFPFHFTTCKPGEAAREQRAPS